MSTPGPSVKLEQALKRQHEQEARMRKSFGTAALLACVTIAATASAQMAMQDGRVTNVDRSGKAFSAQWYNGNALYWTNAATKFSVNGTPTNFSYIKAGMK